MISNTPFVTFDNFLARLSSPLPAWTDCVQQVLWTNRQPDGDRNELWMCEPKDQTLIPNWPYPHTKPFSSDVTLRVGSSIVRLLCSSFLRHTSALSFMHNHSSECPHRYDCCRKAKIQSVSNCVMEPCYFSVTGLGRLSSTGRHTLSHRLAHTQCFYLNFVVQLLDAAVFAWDGELGAL